MQKMKEERAEAGIRLITSFLLFITTLMILADAVTTPIQKTPKSLASKTLVQPLQL